MKVQLVKSLKKVCKSMDVEQFYHGKLLDKEGITMEFQYPFAKGTSVSAAIKCIETKLGYQVLWIEEGTWQLGESEERNWVWRPQLRS